MADGHGRSVLEQFYKTLTDEKLASIKVVTGGGARWITDCVNEFLRTASAALFLFMWLGKAPENLTENQRIRLDMIRAGDPKLYLTYYLKESLRLLLKSTDVRQAEADLKHWLWKASHSRIPAFHDLYKKIRRHKEHILNTIRLGLSNARIEAANNKIKLIIRKAYGSGIYRT